MAKPTPVWLNVYRCFDGSVYAEGHSRKKYADEQHVGSSGLPRINGRAYRVDLDLTKDKDKPCTT